MPPNPLEKVGTRPRMPLSRASGSLENFSAFPEKEEPVCGLAVVLSGPSLLEAVLFGASLLFWKSSNKEVGVESEECLPA
ncbi:hypothetical protein NPIL_347931 [Nephila pilipes]|uniref:Uncharacterized protein n=1 Tax=Nephila pilipes TaxID=299642 RepID=A0A8X6Q3A3_NEPPI|nr:hypothetical protein NPIL_347931 [Nephila pilipes]